MKETTHFMVHKFYHKYNFEHNFSIIYGPRCCNIIQHNFLQSMVHDIEQFEVLVFSYRKRNSCFLTYLILIAGPKAFSDVLWTVEKYIKDGDRPRITFSYHSYDGEGGN